MIRYTYTHVDCCYITIYINLNYIMVWLGLDVIYRPQKYIKEKDRYTIKYKHNNTQYIHNLCGYINN